MPKSELLRLVNSWGEEVGHVILHTAGSIHVEVTTEWEFPPLEDMFNPEAMSA